MNEDEWSDLLWDLVDDSGVVGHKRDQRHKLAEHMAKLEKELTNLRLRVASLEKDLNE